MACFRDGDDLSVETQEAAAVVAAQLGCTLDTALRQMKIMATATDQHVDRVAAKVLDGSLRFDD